EALARLRGPHGVIEAVEFIDIAEGLGLMRRIAQRVQDLALHALPDMPGGIRLFLNMDGEDLLGAEGLQGIVDMAISHGVDPERLVLEMNETTLLRDVDTTVLQLRAVRAQGVAIAIDEFGAGLSSLSQVSRLPVDLLKIDRSFVAAARRDDASRAVLAAVAGIGPALGVDVVLEGVETQADLDIARQLEVTAVQGWQLGSPMTPAELTTALVQGSG
ncbi:MAG TPA: EAL domain-containing protein, partial [Euzebya sp.]|nr:EAL domain-containing protein [Euzebya sp.]